MAQSMDNSLDGLDVSAGSCAEPAGGAGAGCSAPLLRGGAQPSLPAALTYVLGCLQTKVSSAETAGGHRPAGSGVPGQGGGAEPSSALPPAPQPSSLRGSAGLNRAGLLPLTASGCSAWDTGTAAAAAGLPLLSSGFAACLAISWSDMWRLCGLKNAGRVGRAMGTMRGETDEKVWRDLTPGNGTPVPALTPGCQCERTMDRDQRGAAAAPSRPLRPNRGGVPVFRSPLFCHRGFRVVRDQN